MPLGTGSIDLDAIWPLLWESQKPIILEGWDDSRELSLLKQNLLYLETNDCVSF
ncbi:Uncharacterised protein [Mycobacterium tuberculosis]|nr:Uncharacterised protein [Mycobacterium tuberculosis]